MTAPSFSLFYNVAISQLVNNFILTSVLVCLGMVPSPEMNNKMNNKVDGGGTPKPEPKTKVTKLIFDHKCLQ